MSTSAHTLRRASLFLLLCSSLFAFGLPTAEADDRRHGHYKHAHKGKHDYGHHKHSRRDWDRRTVYRERVIVREAPRYHHRHPRVVNNHYYGPPPVYRSYSYSREPAIVIGVDIPPLVIPLR